MASKNVREIRQRLRAMADGERAEQTAGYFKTGPGEYGEGDQFLGIRMPDLRKIAREYKHIPIKDVWDVMESKWHEERMFALVVLADRFDRSTGAERREIYNGYLARTKLINNWDLVDISAHYIVGPQLEDRSRRPLHRLAKSKDMWERRIAILSTYHYIRNGSFETTLEIAETLLRDKEDLIHKAVGWMLREVGNRDRSVEERFLKKYYLEMPRTMLRYAIEKFPERTRQKYLKGSK